MIVVELRIDAHCRHRGFGQLQIRIRTDRIVLQADVILEITQIGKECHQGCEIMKQVGSCIMPTQGIFGKVLKNGTICVGDEVFIIK